MFPDRKDTTPFTTPYLEEQWLGNRQQRRKNKELKGRGTSQIVGEYNRMAILLNDTTKDWNQTVDDQDRDLTKTVFRGKPFIYSWLDIRHDLSQFLERVHFANLETPIISINYLNKLDVQDIFSQPLGERFLGMRILEGTSLFDIEQMPLTRTKDGFLRLEKADFRRINRMFHNDILSPQTQQESIIRQAMIYLATQDLARPEEKIVVPTNLRPLHQRLTAYFDYYKDLMTNLDIDLGDYWEERNFINSLLYAGPWLPQAVGLFTVARLGITSSSAIRLYQTRAEFSLAFTNWWKRSLLPYLESGAKEAVRKNSLPPELAPYQYYDASMDEKITTIFLNLYGREEPSGDLMDIYNRQQALTGSLGIHFKSLQEGIRRTPKRCLEFNLDDHPLIDRVTLTHQNRQALIFILRLKDGNTHLTLEIDRAQNIYGFPAKLISENPHIANLVLLDILPPILEAATKQPSVEPITLSNYRSETKAILPEPEPVLTVPVREKFKPQRPRVLTPLAKFLEGPQPANVVPIEPPKYVVFHSREQVREMVGKNTPERDVDRIMKAIAAFEHGRGDYKRMKEDRMEGEDIWEIRVPPYRVLAPHIDGAFFALSKIGHRREIFNIRQRPK